MRWPRRACRCWSTTIIRAIAKDDPPWEQAVGYHDRDKQKFATEPARTSSAGWASVIKDKIKAWWFDSPYSLDPRGPHNSVTTDMTGFQFPWERFTVAAKLGFPARLVTYNAGVAETFLYTTHQDYWAGELVNLKTPSHKPLPGQRSAVVRLDVPGRPGLGPHEAGHANPEAAVLRRRSHLLRSHLQRHQAPMTFNVGIYQDGTLAPASIAQLQRVHVALGEK